MMDPCTVGNRAAGMPPRRTRIAGATALAAAAAGALAGAVLAGSPALALMAPQYYEQARREAASVIVMKVAKVEAPARQGYGTCTVQGTVTHVERGSVYTPGQAVAIGVPCAQAGAQPPIGGTIWQDFDALKAAPYGRAWLDGEGKVVLSQYERLAAAP